ncbi:hypothetical protein HDF18_04515 [Mucilaginibacter sp. X5P1]|uniref:hypothetical protein n=1 Tax=Mucilaginibacter sp. X5P1 TaxID=2723088 RepID=UPI0016149EA6|nr:hypothetical protein [Mucilaginibacter sp. X5P1]MBB6136883.1 hypothetical protein [Mucilaginibacter sp. X5P1]
MTTTLKTLAVIITLLAARPQNEQKSALMIGTWKVSDIHAEYPATLTAIEKMKAQESFMSMQKMFESSPFVFEKNGDLTVMQKSASWELARDEKSFKIILMKDEGLDADIVSLSAKKLVFTVLDHDIKETFDLEKIK